MLTEQELPQNYKSFYADWVRTLINKNNVTATLTQVFNGANGSYRFLMWKLTRESNEKLFTPGGKPVYMQFSAFIPSTHAYFSWPEGEYYLNSDITKVFFHKYSEMYNQLQYSGNIDEIALIPTPEVFEVLNQKLQAVQNQYDQAVAKANQWKAEWDAERKGWQDLVKDRDCKLRKLEEFYKPRKSVFHRTSEEPAPKRKPGRPRKEA